MRFGQLITEVRGAGEPGELVYAKLAALGGGIPSGSSWHRYAAEPHPDDTGHPLVTRTPWGTVSTMKETPGPASIIGVATALRIADRTAWLAVGESIGLRNMFRGADEEAGAMLAPGWADLRRRRFLLLRSQALALVADQAREDALDTARAELAEAQARIAALEAVNARLTRAANRAAKKRAAEQR